MSWCIRELLDYQPVGLFAQHFVHERSVCVGTTKITNSSQFIETLKVKTASWFNLNEKTNGTSCLYLAVVASQKCVW